MRQELQSAYEEARAAMKADRTPENMEAARVASAALSAWIMQNDPPKVRGKGSRAGRKQAQMREMERQDSLLAHARSKMWR